MGKNNVNPNHYKIAGRDRQGEDILQAHHKQKFAMNQARERFEPRQALPFTPAPLSRDTETADKETPGKEPASARRPDSISAGASTTVRATRSRAKKTTARRAKKSSKTSGTPARKTSRTAAKPSSPARTRKSSGTAARKKQAPVRSRPGGATQASDKRGKRSTAQKRAF